MELGLAMIYRMHDMQYLQQHIGKEDNLLSKLELRPEEETFVKYVLRCEHDTVLYISLASGHI